MIRLDVGLEDGDDRRFRLFCDGKVIFNMLYVWIDDSKFRFARTTKDIRSTPRLWMENLPENHTELLIGVI
jgi:hypothetical protein